MKLKYILLHLCILFLAQEILAGPARNGMTTLVQPDGSTFPALIKGDEFTKIKTTAEGHAVIQDKDGWWCYAIYDPDGGKCSSGWRVGSDVPQEIIASSSYIPYEALSESATRARNRLQSVGTETPLMKILRKNRGMTKAEDTSEDTPVKHGLVILAAYRDIDFKMSRTSFDNLLNKEGYSFNGATGSAKEYFDAQFNGQIEFDFHVTDIVTLQKNRSYYGGNNAYGDDKNPAEMVRDACILADSAVDFSLYDDDGDGEVDNVFVFFAGADEAEGADEECIWSHAWYLKDGAGIRLTLDGKVINRYACTSELARTYNSTGQFAEHMTSIGTFCHEYSHTFGLPDFYDTDYDENGGWAAGLWKTSLMDSGNYNNGGNTPPNYNAIERELLGLSSPELLERSGRYTLEPVNKDGACFRIDADREGEYFLFEYRAAEGWDKHIGGSGMLIYHIDRTSDVTDKWTYRNTVNADHSHQCADLIEADARKDGFSSSNEQATLSRNLNGVFFPYGDNNSFSADGTPAFRFWSGADSPFSLASIKKGNGILTFNLLEKGMDTVPPDAVNISCEAFADAAIIQFESSHLYDGEAEIRWGRKGNEDQEIKVMPYEPGRYSFTLNGLESSKTYGINITFFRDGLEGNTAEASFMTKRMPDVEWPFIHMGSIERNTDGTIPAGTLFPLRVYNASDAAEITWTFNGKAIYPEGNGYWTMNEDGVLKATVIWEDGRCEVLAKEITISR